MSQDINSVTEGRVTVTANDTEDNIRVAAGFVESPDSHKADDAAPKVDETAEKAAFAERERDEAGKFKAKEKPEEVAAKPDGDPRKSIQAKINQAIAKQRDAERRADEAERRAAERDAELQALRSPKATETPVAQSPASSPASAAPTYLSLVQRYQALPDAPKLDDFAGTDDPYGFFQVAMAAFVSDQRQAEREQRESQTRAARERQSHISTAFELAEQAHPGLQEQIEADTRQYPNAVLELIAAEAAQDPQLSAELLHHLLTHPEDADRLALQTHPIAAAREIGRLTAGLSSAPSGPETAPPTTNAKPLIKPVRPSVMARETASLDDLPFSRYMAAMNEQEKKAKAARA